MPSGIGQTHLMVCRITSPAYRVGGVRALASPALAVIRKVSCSLNNYWTSHLDGAGEPSGAIPGEAAPGAPLAAAPASRECPDGPRWTAPTTFLGGGRALIN